MVQPKKGSEGQRDANENLFDLVHKIHQSELEKQPSEQTRKDDEFLLINRNSMLRPQLRLYQTNAIRWMLQRENYRLDNEPNSMDNSKQPELHEFYIELNDKNGKKIYYHRYFGV